MGGGGDACLVKPGLMEGNLGGLGGEDGVFAGCVFDGAKFLGS